MTREQFRLVLGDFGELAFKSFSNAGVKGTSSVAQKGAVSRILHQSVLEKVCCVWSDTLSEEQSCRNEPIERQINFRFRLAHYASHKRM